MAARDLEIEVQRRGRREDVVDMTADPNNTSSLEQFLRDWLKGGGWDRALWPQFSADVRLAGQNKILRTVRP